VLSTASFKSDLVGQSVTDVQCCSVCSELKPLVAFPKHKNNKTGIDTRCRMCIRGQSQLRARLKKQHPTPPPGPCPICKEHTDRWVLDHCHQTEDFRGYICDPCNLGLGKFNDDHIRVKAALDYLLTSTQPYEPVTAN